MKKYVKPELIFEQYELNQHIADCAWEVQSADTSVCQATLDPKMGGDMFTETLFSDALGCTITSGSAYQAYCETNGSDATNTWKS